MPHRDKKRSIIAPAALLLPYADVYVLLLFKLRYKLRCSSRVIFSPVKINK